MSRIDDAIQDSLTDQGRVVTEWVLFACTGLIDHGTALLDESEVDVD